MLGNNDVEGPVFGYNDVEGLPAADKLSDAARGDLQCNILRSTGRYRSKQLFVRFETAEEFKNWLKTTPEVTSAANAGATDRDVNLLFTRSGLKKLVGAAGLSAMDPAFWRGSKDPETLKRLEDDAVKGPHSSEWDAALLIHSDVDFDLKGPASSEANAVVEAGNSLGANGEPIVPGQPGSDARYNVYGYRDGISTNRYEAREDDPAYEKYDPRRKLSTLLSPDPFAAGRFGSYFVFRKYRQDVGEFDQRVGDIAKAIVARRTEIGHVPLEHRYPLFKGVDGVALENLVRAWILGRRPDGTPLAGDPVVGQQIPDEKALNDFTLDVDPNGRSCPFHAHAAKMNPRGRTGNPVNEHRRSLARRGISFGSRSKGPAGILFWCAQASIAEQFEYVQRHWANDRPVEYDDTPTPDLDDLIGKSRVDTRFERPTHPYPAEPTRYDRWKETIDVDFGVYDTITLEGSEYFFAPSLSGIAALKRA